MKHTKRHEGVKEWAVEMEEQAVRPNEKVIRLDKWIVRPLE
jgi:hypothetical protein